MKQMPPTSSLSAVYCEPEMAEELQPRYRKKEEDPTAGASDLIDFLVASSVVSGLLLAIFFAASLLAKM